MNSSGSSTHSQLLSVSASRDDDLPEITTFLRETVPLVTTTKVTPPAVESGHVTETRALSWVLERQALLHKEHCAPLFLPSALSNSQVFGGLFLFLFLFFMEFNSTPTSGLGFELIEHLDAKSITVIPSPLPGLSLL